MGRVLTDALGLSYAEETPGSPGTLPASPSWAQVQPNTLTQFGTTTTTTARNPITRNRQRQKGRITDLDSGVGFETDLTLAAFRDFIDGFTYSRRINRDMVGLLVSVVTAAHYVPDVALVAAQAAKINSGTLLWARGFGVAANNGLKHVNANVAAGANITADGLAAEASAPDAARVSFAGYRIPAASSPTWTWDATSRRATLALTGIGTTLMGLGLAEGQVVHIGSIATAGNTAIQNALGNNGNANYGYARVIDIQANSVIFDRVELAVTGGRPGIQASANPPNNGALDILFGEFCRNVATDDSDYVDLPYQIEAGFPNLIDRPGQTSVDGYEYALGNACNTLALALPLTDKATLTYGFVGTDTESPVQAQKTNAGAARRPLDVEAFNTTADFARLRIIEADEDGISTDFKSLNLALNNNVSPEKVLARLGARYLNAGVFEVDIEAQLLFTSAAVTAAIRNNTTVAMDFILKNGDGVLAFDIPSMILGGGEREYPRGESVLINTTNEAFEDPILITSIGASIIPVPLP